MGIVYLDLYFFINLLADYLLCLSAARLCSLSLKRLRYSLASLLGAAFATAALFPALGFLWSPPALLGLFLLMGWICFGAEQAPLRCILMLGMVASAFGGLVYALRLMSHGASNLSIQRLLICFVLCYGLLRLLSRARRRWEGQPTIQIRVTLCGREACFPALSDSGNALRDPVTGCRVLIASLKALRPILDSDTALLEELEPVDLITAAASIPTLHQKLRLIPYRTLSGDGMLPIFRPDSIRINGAESHDTLVAISRQAAGNGFEAIL